MNVALISKYLLYLRQEKNYTQEKLATELGVSRQTISKWETAQGIPGIDTLLTLSKFYNITINQILEPKLENYIEDFEDIITIDCTQLKMILLNVTMEDIMKASMGASPQINVLLQQMYQDIDCIKERELIGFITVDEVELMQSQIVSIINVMLSSDT